MSVNLCAHFVHAQCMRGLPRMFNVAQDCHKIEFHLTILRNVVYRRNEWQCSKVSEPRHRAAAAVSATDPVELRTDMVTAADLTALQQLLSHEVAVVIQQMRVAMTGTINSRLGMLSSITTALQNVSAKPTDSKPYRISDLIPRS